ncbi:MAG: hypothetical protein U0V87_05020 [Acidobacteriota bacterium]
MADNVDVPRCATPADAADRKQQIDQALSTVKLKLRARVTFHHRLSGERGNAVTSRCDYRRPVTILADKPDGSLDTMTMAGEILDLLSRSTAASTTIVMVTHNTQAASHGRARCI